MTTATPPRADDHWYRTAFGPLTAGFWTSLVPQQRVEEEARFLAAALQAPPGGRLLDVPCGAGRQARALARLGWRVQGLDISEHMLAACDEPLPDGVTLRQGDMVALEDSESFDGAYCWGNSFGYVSDEESRSFLRRVARALRPGARFVLETGAVAENILSSFQPRTVVAARGYQLTAERHYEIAESASHIRYRIERDGQAEEFIARQVVYTTGEIVRMAAQAGLAVDVLYGGIAGEPAALGRSLIAVFRRP